MILAKIDGTPLDLHIDAVYACGVRFNDGLSLGLDIEAVKWFAILHDLGKANPHWKDNIIKNNFNDFVYRHEIGSLAFIDIVPEKYKELVSMLVLSHHKSIDNDDRSFNTLFCDDVYMQHYDDISIWGIEVKKLLKTKYGITCNIPSFERCSEIAKTAKDVYNNLEYGYSEYRGLCMMADEFASYCTEQYPYCKNILELNKEIDFLCYGLFQIPDTSLFNIRNNDYPLSLIDKNETKKHTFTIAPTSSGKTNFAMRMCKGRVFYVLPYQASSDAMYGRFKKVFHSKQYTIGLKHGSSWDSELLSQKEKELSNFYGLPITVMTPYQIFHICLCSNRYETTINDIKNCDVILDEVHTYSGINKSAVYALIDVLVRIGCRIHIITATMPSDMQSVILEKLGVAQTQITKLSDTDTRKYNRHIVHISDIFDINEIVKKYKQGYKVMVVRNQRKLAQKIYKELRDIVGSSNMRLLHSSMKRKKRCNIENELLDIEKRKEGFILVSTQIVEVSLDIDFDTLYTDCADICSLIQRFGRVNRHRKNISECKDVYIIKPKDKSYLPYDQTCVQKTFDLFKQKDGCVLDECEKQIMIDYVHPIDKCPTMNKFNPYGKDGKWGRLLYSNSKMKTDEELEFEMYVGLCENDVDEYMQTYDKGLEIPITKSDVARFSLEKIKNTQRNIYIIPSKRYDNELGFIL
jgi:CRISPR-associated endonuclease/helicase Cas3